MYERTNMSSTSTTTTTTNSNSFFQQTMEEASSLIIAKVKEMLLNLKEKFDETQLKLMRTLSYYGEQETRYQRQIEPLGRLSKLIKAYIKEDEKMGSHQIDKEKLTSLYLEEYKKLREDFIEGRKEFFKSREQYFDKETEEFILLNHNTRQALLDKFIVAMDINLSRHKAEFMRTLSPLDTISELSEYRKSLDMEVVNMNAALDEILRAKTPYMEQHNDNEEQFIRDKKKIVNHALLDAVQSDDLPACFYCMKAKPDILFQNDEGFSVLHLAQNTNMVKWLLLQKAAMTLTLNYAEPYDHRGFTPLHWHVLQGNTDIVKLLLHAGAEVDAISAQKVTPLFLATKIKPNPEIVEILMEHGANVRAKNEKGHFAMGPSSEHTNDKFTDMAFLTEEFLGKQASKGMQAFHSVQKQQAQLERMEKAQLQFQKTLDNLQQENALLKKQVELLQKALTNTQKPEQAPAEKSNHDTNPSSPGFYQQ